MGATSLTRPSLSVLPVLAVRVLSFTVVFALGGACTSPVARPPDDATVSADGSPAPAPSAEVAPSAAASFRWPETGWLRLDVDVFVALDSGADASATAMLAARWEPGDLEIWIDAPDPGELGARAGVHRRESAAVADATVEGLRGTFEASLADGLEPANDARLGAWVFTATGRDHDATVAQRWQIGAGGPPWGPHGPFAPGS